MVTKNNLLSTPSCLTIPLHNHTWCSLTISVKVKCTPCTGTADLYRPTVHRGSTGIALPFHDLGTRRGWGDSVMSRPLFTPGKEPVPIVQEAGWAPGPVWTGAENLAPTGIRTPDPPARSQSLYRQCMCGELFFGEHSRLSYRERQD